MKETKGEVAQSRLDLVRRLLLDGKANTQESIRDWMEEQGHSITQSTVSRILRKLNAVRATGDEGEIIYRLPEEELLPSRSRTSLVQMVKEIETNGTLVVIHTTPGSASLIARHLDRLRSKGILGTLAGDDTVFVASAKSKVDAKFMNMLKQSLAITV
jgi:transcriptional regulator of arginine metabolism